MDTPPSTPFLPLDPFLFFVFAERLPLCMHCWMDRFLWVAKFLMLCSRGLKMMIRDPMLLFTQVGDLGAAVLRYLFNNPAPCCLPRCLPAFFRHHAWCAFFPCGFAPTLLSLRSF